MNGKVGRGTINIVNMDLSVSYKVNAPGKVKRMMRFSTLL